ncbi:MAG: rhomboid family intramembrane serine protease [Pseudomonadota bacterium]
MFGRPDPGLADVVMNLFRHGTRIHLAGNLAILLIAGLRVEREIGSKNTLLLMAACAVLGGAAQWALVGPNFVGISGPAYGLATYAVMRHIQPGFLVLMTVILVAIAVGEVLLLADRVAVWTHVVSIFIATSDYAENGVPIYANAFRLYEEFGANIELKIPDYHSPGETKIVYGLANPEYPDLCQ